MARVALVTGGTRGIGAAITKALKAAGYKVAANYGGNDEAAQKFKAETGVPVFKWDVSSYDACAEGIKKVEGEVGPVEVLVNNAGITRDAMFHRMKPEQWTAVINTNLGSLFNMCRPLIEGMRDRKFGRIINISSINGQKGQMGQANYSAAKAGELGFTKALAQEGARVRHYGERDLPRLHQHRNGASRTEGRSGKIDPSADSDRPSGRARGDRALRGVPRVRRSGPDHRRNVECERWAIFRLAPAVESMKKFLIAIVAVCLFAPAAAIRVVRTGRRCPLQRYLRQSRLRMCRTERWANHSPTERGQARRAEAAPDGRSGNNPDA